jgi:hypothetical protein
VVPGLRLRRNRRKGRPRLQPVAQRLSPPPAGMGRIPAPTRTGCSSLALQRVAGRSSQAAPLTRSVFPARPSPPISNAAHLPGISSSPFSACSPRRMLTPVPAALFLACAAATPPTVIDRLRHTSALCFLPPCSTPCSHATQLSLNRLPATHCSPQRDALHPHPITPYLFTHLPLPCPLHSFNNSNYEQPPEFPPPLRAALRLPAQASSYPASQAMGSCAPLHPITNPNTTCSRPTMRSTASAPLQPISSKQAGGHLSPFTTIAGYPACM